MIEANERLEGENGGWPAMFARLVQGDVRALARAISVVEDGGRGAEDLLSECSRMNAALGRSAQRIGLTGPPGVGKSTLADQMARWLRAKGRTVGILAVDPSSPYTGGALLGDRIRMQGFSGDDGVYFRSMATRGAVGGLARAAAAVCTVLEAAGRETLLVETVGVGQDEVEVAGLADVTVLVLVPGLGDDVQSLKAGVMEVADIYVVNKSDLPGAERVEQEILLLQSLGTGDTAYVPPLIRTVANTGDGIQQLMEAIERCAALRGPRKLAGLPMNQSLRIDHLGVAVRSIEAARGFYQLLGLHVGEVETVEQEHVRVAMLPLGESRIELLEPIGEDSTMGRFLARRGEGMHHIALRVKGIDAQFARLAAAGVRLASDGVRVGAGGHRYFFVHPASTGGVLVELVGD